MAPSKKTAGNDKSSKGFPPATATAKTPPKRKSANFAYMNSSPSKKKQTTKTPKEPFQVNGHAFHEDIIVITHEKNDKSDAFNGKLRDMIANQELNGIGISSWVTLRDVASGTDDRPLVGSDGYNRIMFLNIGNFFFANTEEAKPPTMENIRAVYGIMTDPINNRFGYLYGGVSDQKYKSHSGLSCLSDKIRYIDTFRVMVGIFGEDNEHLPANFAREFPDTVRFFFPAEEEIPSYLKEKLEFRVR